VVSAGKLAEVEAGLDRQVGMTSQEWDTYLEAVRSTVLA
jgi:hypothetical protein